MSKNKTTFSALITSAERQRDIANNTDFIDVAFDISDGNSVIESRRLAFTLTFSEKQIQDELKKFITLYSSEKETEDERREQDKQNTTANEIIAGLVGKKI